MCLKSSHARPSMRQGEIDDVPKITAGGIIRNQHLAKIGVMSAPDRPGLAAAVLRALGQHGINVEFIVQCVDLKDCSHVVLCVADENMDAAVTALTPVGDEVGAGAVISQHGVALISVFGPDFRERPAVAAGVFEALASAGINILAISTSISTVSCLLDGARVDDAVLALREYFELP
jgi:aspartate kinase